MPKVMLASRDFDHKGNNVYVLAWAKDKAKERPKPEDMTAKISIVFLTHGDM